jgi:hypothetical protein
MQNTIMYVRFYIKASILSPFVSFSRSLDQPALFPILFNFDSPRS